jgi:hypothetical protein
MRKGDTIYEYTCLPHVKVTWKEMPYRINCFKPKEVE